MKPCFLLLLLFLFGCSSIDGFDGRIIRAWDDGLSFPIINMTNYSLCGNQTIKQVHCDCAEEGCVVYCFKCVDE